MKSHNRLRDMVFFVKVGIKFTTLVRYELAIHDKRERPTKNRNTNY